MSSLNGDIDHHMLSTNPSPVDPLSASDDGSDDTNMQVDSDLDIHKLPDADADGEDDDDDGTLLTVQPGFNRLLLVLRDERVMHFVKYVSAAAEGPRWDVCGEYEIGIVAEE